jgi:hypothetical protein
MTLCVGYTNSVSLLDVISAHGVKICSPLCANKPSEISKRITEEKDKNKIHLTTPKFVSFIDKIKRNSILKYLILWSLNY